MEPTDHEWIVGHCSGMFKHLLQLRIVIVRTAFEARPDLLVARLVELPPRALEVEHRPLALVQFIVSDLHRDSLTRLAPEVVEGVTFAVDGHAGDRPVPDRRRRRFVVG